MALDGIKVYVLSVKTFYDRIQSIQEQSARFGFNFEFIFDYDVDDLCEADLERFDRTALTVPAISLIHKHLEAERRFLSSSYKYCLIFEDDVVLVKEFSARLECVLDQTEKLPSGFLVFFGGTDNYIDPRFSECRNKNQLIAKKISTAEGYLTDRHACLKRIKYIEELEKITLGADHLLQHVDEELGINQYWVCKPLVYQGSLTGRFKTELDAGRKKYPAAFIWLRFHYNRKRRNWIRRIWYKIISLRFLGR